MGTTPEPVLACQELSRDILTIGTIETMEKVQLYDRLADGLRRVAEGASAKSIEQCLVSLKPHSASQRVLHCQSDALPVEGIWHEIIFYMDVPHDGPAVMGYQIPIDSL